MWKMNNMQQTDMTKWWQVNSMIGDWRCKNVEIVFNKNEKKMPKKSTNIDGDQIKSIKFMTYESPEQWRFSICECVCSPLNCALDVNASWKILTWFELLSIAIRNVYRSLSTEQQFPENEKLRQNEMLVHWQMELFIKIFKNFILAKN